MRLRDVILYKVVAISSRLTFKVTSHLWTYNLLKSKSESELALVAILCRPNQIALDIGASRGLYSARMAIWSKEVICFEPHPSSSRLLKETVAKVFPSMTVHSVALSNQNGLESFKFEFLDPGRSRIIYTDSEKGNFGVRMVPVKTLDIFQLGNISLIKIDVEGFEFEVLEGALETIKKSRPAIIIEIEERHREGSFGRVRNFLRELNYTGIYLENGIISTLDNFDLESLQNATNAPTSRGGYKRESVYINNFNFLPEEHNFLSLIYSN